MRKTSDAFEIDCFAIEVAGENINIFNCQGNNVSYESGFSQCGGLLISLSTNILVKDSQFNNAFGEDSVIVNSNLGLNLSDVYINCQFNGARGGKRARIICGVHRSSGFAQVVNGKGCKYINCQFNGSRVDPENPGGNANNEVGGFFSIATNGDLFENCEFSDHDVGDNDNIACIGCLIGTQAYREQPGIPGIGEAYCQTFKNCRFNDIRGGYRTGGLIIISNDLNLSDIPLEGPDTRVLQEVMTDFIIENCSASRIFSRSKNPEIVFGIMQGLWPDFFSPDRSLEPFPVIDTYFPKMINLQIKDCRVSNVKSATKTRVCAGIVVESVTNPELSGNSVTDCDRGILLTGVDKIIPNGFQLAATKDLSLACPPQFLTLTDPLPAATPLQTFSNVTRGSSINISPVASVALPGTNIPSPGIFTLYDMIFPEEDLNVLGWKAGDRILYNSNGGSNINGLVSGSTYYLVVYVPGYSERGVVQNNTVSNCSLSGFQDDKVPCTSSVWLSNTAYCNGTEGKYNYEINWGCNKPVAKGTLSCYPKPKYHTENISISCGKCDCKKHKCKH